MIRTTINSAATKGELVFLWLFVFLFCVDQNKKEECAKQTNGMHYGRSAAVIQLNIFDADYICCIFTHDSVSTVHIYSL
ncbi:hypothetical protein RB195_021438 [Necator americanus]|uniref:Secreted protein n=1 Tax=Necator americanus TaxID=51031 RepID=A0ABR1EB08_NECAM